MKRQVLKLKVMTIVHGKSEYIMCSSIKSNLKIQHHIHSKNKGRNSIQVNSVMNVLNTADFKMSLSKFAKKYNIEYDSKNKKLIKFKLFIIMDLDDCTKDKAKQFKNKSMFEKHFLYDYIIPIYNDPNLEKTIRDIGIHINEKEKVKEYFRIFPTSSGDLDIHMAKDLASKLEKCKNSNLGQYFEYCISIAENRI